MPMCSWSLLFQEKQRCTFQEPISCVAVWSVIVIFLLQKVYNDAMKKLHKQGGSLVLEQNFCTLLNISVCPMSENGNKVGGHWTIIGDGENVWWGRKWELRRDMSHFMINVF